MKLKIVLIILISMFCLRGFSQDDPLVKQSQGVFKLRTKLDMAKDEAKLIERGKIAFEQAKNDLKNIRDAKFELAPNEILNRDPKDLLGIPENEKPDLKIGEQQNIENLKNERVIKESMRAVGLDVSQIDFSYKTNPIRVATCTWATTYTTPVKDQRSCGSCWAFAACAAFEHTYAKFKLVQLDLSEEDLVNCGYTCSNVNCGSCLYGGHSYRAFDYMKCKGISSEASYPYTATDRSCSTKPKTAYAAYWGQLFPGRFPTVNEIKVYVNYYGAVVTYLKAGLSTFKSYGGGAYNGYPSNSSNEIDHAVIIVGWCDSLNSWIIKNSWGENWGPYGGYAYVDYNSCNIGKYVYWVWPKF